MKKVVINACFGGFGLSDKAEDLYADRSGFQIFRYTQTKYKHSDGEELYEKVEAESGNLMTWCFKKDYGDSFSKFPERDDSGYWYSRDIEREDPLLVSIVEELGAESGGDCASLKVVEIPDDVEWEVSEYDGNEHIAQVHETWD